jgi:hypothetical protein
MRMFICTFPRMQPLRILCALVAAFLLSSPLAAQSTPTRNTGPQANLHINVNVVRAVGVHRHDKDKDRDKDDGTVSYNLMPRDEELSVTREVRPMLVEVQGIGAQKQPVNLTTVVAR